MCLAVGLGAYSVVISGIGGRMRVFNKKSGGAYTPGKQGLSPIR